MEPDKEHLQVLKAYFGHKEFKPCQWKVISSILHKQDNCVVMATGYGKSLCYQFPSVYLKGTAFVISPLISLMQDQVLALKLRNIPATFLGSAQKSKDVLNDVLDNKFRVVYLTPEWCTNIESTENFFKNASEKINIVLVAIDEAHCVSQWGMDFRPPYRKLGLLRTLLPSVPFMAVTATANASVREDICLSLNLRKPLITVTSFNRPNLFLSASLKGDDIYNDVKNLMLKCKYFETPGSCIIYAPTKKAADNIATKLNINNLNCALYHADLSLSVRERVHEDFARDKISLVVATVAFGMGIDKPDVRLIIHYGAPKEIETYYQEIGRAGRDGLPATCHAFYSQSDFNLNQEHKEEMVKIMERYLISSNCRRELLISHFDPGYKKELTDNCCDNCIQEKYQKKLEYDLTVDILLLLEAVLEINGKYGLSITNFLLRGSSNKRLPQQYQNHKLFGAGRHKTEEWWKLLGKLLILEGLIDENIINGAGWNKTNFPMKTIKLSTKGRQYLFNEAWRKKIQLQPTPEMLKHVAMPSRDGWYISGQSYAPQHEATTSECIDTTPTLEEIVFSELLTFRSKTAKLLDCTPHMLFNNRTAQILSRQRPQSIVELSFIEGITDSGLEKFGQACLDCIKCSIEKHKSFDNAAPKSIKRFVKKQKKVLSYDDEDTVSSETNNEDTVTIATNNDTVSTATNNDSSVKESKTGGQSFFEEDEDELFGSLNASKVGDQSFFEEDEDELFNFVDEPPKKKPKDEKTEPVKEKICDAEPVKETICDASSYINKKLDENDKKKKTLMKKIKL